MIPTEAEQTAAERQQKELALTRAEQLAERLRAMGIDPDRLDGE